MGPVLALLAGCTIGFAVSPDVDGACFSRTIGFEILPEKMESLLLYPIKSPTPKSAPYSPALQIDARALQTDITSLSEARP